MPDTLIDEAIQQPLCCKTDPILLTVMEESSVRSGSEESSDWYSYSLTVKRILISAFVFIRRKEGHRNKETSGFFFNAYPVEMRYSARLNNGMEVNITVTKQLISPEKRGRIAQNLIWSAFSLRFISGRTFKVLYFPESKHDRKD